MNCDVTPGNSWGRVPLVSSLGVALLLIGACTAAVAPPPPLLHRAGARGQHVLVVTIDTLRRDRLGAYGHDGGLDADTRRPGGTRRAGDPRLLARAPDVAGTRFDPHRPHAATPRPAPERRRTTGRRRADAGDGLRRGGVSHRRVRRRLRPRRPLRARPRLRGLRRSAAAGWRPRFPLRRTAGRRRRRGRRRLDSGRQHLAVAGVGAPVRSARAVRRAAALRGRATTVRRRGGLHRRDARPPARSVAQRRRARPHAGRRHRRSRRGARRPRRAHARALRLRRHARRPADCQRPRRRRRRHRRAGRPCRPPADARGPDRRASARRSGRVAADRPAARRSDRLLRSARRQPDARMGAADRCRHRRLEVHPLCPKPSSTTARATPRRRANVAARDAERVTAARARASIVWAARAAEAAPVGRRRRRRGTPAARPRLRGQFGASRSVPPPTRRPTIPSDSSRCTSASTPRSRRSPPAAPATR